MKGQTQASERSERRQVRENERQTTVTIDKQRSSMMAVVLTTILVSANILPRKRNTVRQVDETCSFEATNVVMNSTNLALATSSRPYVVSICNYFLIDLDFHPSLRALIDLCSALVTKWPC